MKITIAAANGFIGSYLSVYLTAQGHDVSVLVRRPTGSPHRHFLWNPFTGEIDLAAIDGQDVIINLAGKNVAEERWNDRVKREIVQSRNLATELIGKSIAKVASKPRLLLNASAVGYYGNRVADELISRPRLPVPALWLPLVRHGRMRLDLRTTPALASFVFV